MPKKHKWTEKEINEILSQPFHCFPTPKRAGVARGPNEAYHPVYINDPVMRRKCALKGKPITNKHRKVVDLMWGSAGCHTKDTEILMFDGSVKKVQDIVIGDRLMGPDSTPRTVLGLCRGKDTMYEITPTKGDSFIVNGDHVLSLKTSGYKVPNGRRGGGTITGTVLNMTVREYLKLAKNRKHCLKLYKPEGGLNFKSKEVPLDPYLLGIWLGDGSSNATQITNIDSEILDHCKEVATSLGVSFNRNQETISYTFSGTGRVDGNPIRNALFKELNLQNNKHIPKCYLRNSRDVRLALLAGLIDSDGHYHHGYYEVVQKNKVLSGHIAFLARSLGFGVSFKKVKKYCHYLGQKREGTYFKISILGDVSTVPVKLPRKVAPPRKQIKDVLVSGFKVKELDTDDFYGFTLDKDHLYLMGDFTVTHNSGKTTSAVALGLSYAINYPGSIGLVGARVYGDIKDNVIRLYKELLTINEEWDHPLVVRYPNDHNNKELVLKIPLGGGGFAYSVIKFMHFQDWERLRGRSPDWIHFEEMSQMEDVSVLDELDRRCRGTVLPIRHIFCTTNPPKDFSHFIYERWGIRQFQDGYDGPRLPMGSPCTCQFCQDCLNNDLGEFGFGEDGFCINPECATLAVTGKRGVRDTYKIGNEELYCEGNEEFWRAFLFKMTDNPHLPMDQQQSNKAGTDAKTYSLYSEGKVIELDDDYCYPKFTQANINPFNRALEDKDVILACDANTRPQCTAVIQEEYGADDILKRIDVIDNIIVHSTKRPNPLRPGAGPADVALEFMERYSLENYPYLRDRTIWLWGDPNAHGNTQDPFQPSFYQIVFDVLTEAGYKVKMGISSAKGNNKHSVIDKITNVNELLEDVHGTRRFFVNPKAEETIMSLQENKWDPSGKAVKNKQPDKLNFKAKTIRKRPLTHITDAIDAYIAFKFNVIKKDNISFFQITGDIASYIRNGKIVKAERAKAIEKIFSEAPAYQPTLKDLLEQHMQDMGDGPNLTFYFG